jgi:TonB family protein
MKVCFMSRRCIVLLITLVIAVSGPLPAQDSSTSANARRIVRQVAPVYPELARHMSITGAVRIVATVAPNGSVKSIASVGGNPVLLKAAQEAVMNWKYAAGPAETKELIELRFNAH